MAPVRVFGMSYLVTLILDVVNVSCETSSHIGRLNITKMKVHIHVETIRQTLVRLRDVWYKSNYRGRRASPGYPTGH